MNEKLEKLSRQRAAAEKKLIAAQHREKQLEHELKRLTRSEMHTPLKKCSLTADDGASPPLKWCTNSAEMVHGGRRRGARGRHAGNHSGMPLRLRMDSPSIWMV